MKKFICEVKLSGTHVYKQFDVIVYADNIPQAIDRVTELFATGTVDIQKVELYIN